MRMIAKILKLIIRNSKYKKYKRLISYNRYRSEHIYFDKIKTLMKIVFARVSLRVLRLVPVKNNRIMILSYEAKSYSCNPRVVSEYLQNNYPGRFEIIWAFTRPQDYQYLVNRGIRTAKYRSLKYYALALSSKIYIYNMRIPEEIPFKRNQIRISTGHGGGAYKKLLLDQKNTTRKDRFKIKYSTNNTSLFVSSCKAYSHYVIRGAYGFDGEILETGMPRNDVLVNNDISIGIRARKYYELSHGKKIVLYAPTYRKNKKNTKPYDIDIEGVIRACESRFGGEWVFMYRLHHFVKAPFTLDDEYEIELIDATNYPDMQDLLMCSDILITDYSSSMWDMSLLFKPCFLYASDIDYYNRTQGFYTDIRELPFALARDNDELTYVISNFDQENYKIKVKAHHTKLGSLDHGDATKLVADRIVDVCGGK